MCDKGYAALHARVSGHDQCDDLERQLGRLQAFAVENNLCVLKEFREIGSGLNGHRKKLAALLADPRITTIVVEHRDRLMRFGSDYVEAALSASGRHLLIVDKTEMKDGLVHDMIDVLTSFCARLYGRRSAKSKAFPATDKTSATP